MHQPHSASVPLHWLPKFASSLFRLPFHVICFQGPFLTILMEVSSILSTHTLSSHPVLLYCLQVNQNYLRLSCFICYVLTVPSPRTAGGKQPSRRGFCTQTFTATPQGLEKCLVPSQSSKSMCIIYSRLEGTKQGWQKVDPSQQHQVLRERRWQTMNWKTKGTGRVEHVDHLPASLRGWDWQDVHAFCVPCALPSLFSTLYTPCFSALLQPLGPLCTLLSPLNLSAPSHIPL